MPEPDFVQPSLIVEDEDKAGKTGLAGSQASADQPAAEPTDDTQIVQPPMELPTPGEDPLQDPEPPSAEEPATPNP